MGRRDILFCMQVTVNGQKTELPEGTTVLELIERLGLSVCAAEVNRQLVAHKDRASRTLADGDTVEIVTLVGGG